jgi:hypothetical protein
MNTFLPVKCTGFTSQAKGIKMMHVWSDIYNTNNEIFYYGTSNKSSSAHVVELQAGSSPDTLVVNLYPMASLAILEELEKVKDGVFKLFARLSHDFPDRETFCIDVESLEEVTYESFKRYSIHSQNPFELFIFRDFTKGNKLVEQVYLLENKTTPEFIETNSVQSWASHWIFPLEEKPTEIGKYLTYLLIRSTLEGKIAKRCEHALRNTNFPSLPTSDIPSFYNTDALDKLAKSSGADKIVKAGGKYIDTGGTPEIVDDYSSVFSDEPGMKSIEDKMCRDIINKGTINYSDMLCFGVPETLRLVQTDRLIHINMDMSGISQKAVIFAGFVYAIPWNSTSDAVQTLYTDLGDSFINSTHESIPSNASFMLPN